MSVKQGITVAALVGVTALGLAAPAFADEFDHRGHGHIVSEDQCRNGGGHVRDEEPSSIFFPATSTLPARNVRQNYAHCHDGRYSGMQVRTDDDD